MATRADTRERSTAAAERTHHRTNLWHQAALFVGLFLSPFAGLLTAWIIHVWIGGAHVHWGPVNWDVNSSPAAGPVAVSFATLVSVLIAYLGWQFAEHRKTALRGSLAGSIVTLGVFFSINVGTGPNWFLSGLFILVSWAVALIWSIARLDVTRNDKRGDEEKGDGFLEKVGLKGWRSRKVTHHTDEHGDPLSTEIEFQHAEGDTVDQLQEAVPAFESASASPRGLSRAVPGDSADRSTVTVMHGDPLDVPGGIEIPPLEHEGGSIQQPILSGKYSTGEYVRVYLAGDPTGQGRFSPSSYLKMGMNRTGKTQGENVELTDVQSRRDVVILYMNKAKGMQDARPIIPGIEVAVIESEEGSSAQYREAVRQIKNMISYRQKQLALFGIHEWNASECWDNPPYRTENGRRIRMERIPFLIVHVGEADAILQDAPGDCTYVVSKGLSVGIDTGWSLQRADATKMPTGLRFNLGTSWCYGCGDDDSVSMALTSWVIKAGAHPDQWGQRKPGYFYFEGLGIDEKLFPVMARGFGKGENGEKLRDTLLRRNLRNAPRMAKLDRGTANATGQPGQESWWDKMAKSTEELRRSMLAGVTVLPEPVPDDRPRPATASATRPQPADDGEESEEEVREEIAREMRETTEVDGFELYPQDAETGDRATYDDAARKFDPVPADQQMSWADPKPEARDRKAALLELARNLEALMQRTDLRDPADPTGCTVIVAVSDITEIHKYRSRPWFWKALNDLANGTISREECPTDVLVSRAPDLGPAAGKYRLQRPSAGHTR